MVRSFVLVLACLVLLPFSTLAQSETDDEDVFEPTLEDAEIPDAEVDEAPPVVTAEEEALLDTPAVVDEVADPWADFEPATDAPVDDGQNIETLAPSLETFEHPVTVDDAELPATTAVAPMDWSPRGLWTRGQALSTPRKALVAGGAGVLLAGAAYSTVSFSSTRWACSDGACGSYRSVRGGLPVAIGAAVVSSAAFYTAWKYDDWFSSSPNDPTPFAAVTPDGAAVGLTLRF